LQLGLVAGLALAESPDSTWQGIWGTQKCLGSARKREPITGCLALRFIWLMGLALLSRPAFGQVSAENRSPHLKGQITDIHHPVLNSDAKLVFRVYNYARINPELLDGAERVAEGIFEGVGVPTAWVDCAASPVEVRAYPACQSEMGTADLVLRILPARMAKKLRASEEALGSAQPCPDSEPACELTVFYSRIEELASEGYRPERILGYVIAHEVGHVLVGAGHSEVGIMRREWSPYDLQRISWGMKLDFSSEQSKQLRGAVLRRTKRPVEEVTTQANLIAP
jgi:hypothetical protein